MRLKNYGFTFIEMIIALSIISVISVAIVAIFLTTVRGSVRSEAMKEIKQNGDYALDVMTRNIANAAAIIDPMVDSSNSITTVDFDGIQTVFEVNVGNCRLQMTVDPNPPVYLINSSVGVHSTSPDCNDGFVVNYKNRKYGRVVEVELELNLAHSGSETTGYTQKFKAVGLLRNFDY